MRTQYDLIGSKRKFNKSQIKLEKIHKNDEELSNIEKKLMQDMELLNKNSIDIKVRGEIEQSLIKALQKNGDMRKECQIKVEKELQELKRTKCSVVEMLYDTKNQNESFKKRKILLEKFNNSNYILHKITEDVVKLEKLKKEIESVEIQYVKSEIFTSISDREDMSWEIEELLQDRKMRAEAFSEVCSGLQDIYQTNIESKVGTLEYAEASCDVLTTTMNVITISTALVGEVISRKIKGEKE